MNRTDADFYKAVGFFRGSGLLDAQAYSLAQEAMEVPMTTFNILLVRNSALTIAFQAGSFNEAVRKSAATIRGWRHEYDPIQRVFISELDKTIDLLEYRPEEITELAGHAAVTNHHCGQRQQWLDLNAIRRNQEESQRHNPCAK